MKNNLLIALLFVPLLVFSQKKHEVSSPDNKLKVSIETGADMTYSLSYDENVLIQPSPISMTVNEDKVWGKNAKIKNVKRNYIDQSIQSPLYKRSTIKDNCNELVLTFNENFQLIIRAYNEGMAYRFVAVGKDEFIVKDEEATFNFNKNYNVYTPYVRSKSEELEKQYFQSFENLYTHTSLKEINPKLLSFSPLVVELDNGLKLCIAESDLENYPGMFLRNTDQSTSLHGHFAPYPKKVEHGGYNLLQELVTERENYIAKGIGKTNFPWRIAVVSTNDKDLADNDMVYKLASPSRIEDNSWIKPGKVAWEWWNNWGLKNVDFKTGVNNETYMAYIDFASKYGIEYVILDEGWAVNKKSDLFLVVPEINLEKLISYANSKNVGLILWAGYYAFNRDMEKVCKHYSEMGIKGFKVDFMDRDDQPMVEFHYKAAEIAAKYKLILDYHGTYKPTGLNRTYPNVVNFEGVHGLEQSKWNDITFDQVTYDVTMPFIRMLAGPIDYTQGAMRNGSKQAFRPINQEPMSQGTRCRQLAEYVIFESPLNMLCDSPSLYEREQDCTAFIASIPTVWDETISLNGKIGEYLTIARRKDNTWYIGSLTNWSERELIVDLSFLGTGNYEAEIFKDGINANKIASDYVKEVKTIPADRKISINMAEGGGYAMKIYKK